MNKKEIKKWVEFIYSTEPRAHDYVRSLCGDRPTESDLIKLLKPAIPHFVRKDKELREKFWATRQEMFDRLLDGGGGGVSGEARVIYAAKRPYEENPKRCLEDFKRFMKGRPKEQIRRIIARIKAGK